MYLLLRIRRDDVPDPAEVAAVHADDAVEPGIVLRHDGAGPLGGVEPHSVLGETPLGGRVDGIAVLLVGDCGGLDIERILKAAGLYQRLQDELGHGRPADIAVADKEDARHSNVS